MGHLIEDEPCPSVNEPSSAEPQLSAEDLRARLADVVSQIAAIGIQIEEIVALAQAGKNTPALTVERRILMDKRQYLYREEAVLRRHLRSVLPTLTPEASKADAQAMILAQNERIEELKAKIEKLRAVTPEQQQELRDLQLLRAKTRKTQQEVYQDGVNRGRYDHDRLVGILHQVAIGNEAVIAAVKKSFSNVKREVPMPVIKADGTFENLRDPNLP